MSSRKKKEKAKRLDMTRTSFVRARETSSYWELTSQSEKLVTT